MPENPDDRMRLRDAAKLLKVSTQTLRRRIQDGTLPAYRLGEHSSPWLVRRSDVEMLLKPSQPAQSEGTHPG